MKKSILTVSLLVLLFSCTKEDDNIEVSNPISIDNSIRNYSSDNGTTLQLTNSTWYTQKLNNFGYVNLIISGSTNADKVIVMTIGDGLIGESDVLLDSNKKFISDTTGISFTTAPSVDLFEQSTKLKAIKGEDTLVVTLKSGNLTY